MGLQLLSVHGYALDLVAGRREDLVVDAAGTAVELMLLLDGLRVLDYCVAFVLANHLGCRLQRRDTLVVDWGLRAQRAEVEVWGLRAERDFGEVLVLDL